MTVLILGGAASGKSRLAESLCTHLGGKRIYLATMEPWGEEGDRRVRRHREMRREKGFATVECYRDLDRLVLAETPQVILLECVGNLLANEMFREIPAANIVKTVLCGIQALENQTPNCVVVSNLVFYGAERYEPETERYIQLLGAINRELAINADVVLEAVAGIPVYLKGKLAEGWEKRG